MALMMGVGVMNKSVRLYLVENGTGALRSRAGGDLTYPRENIASGV